MNKLQRMGIWALAAALAVGGSTAFAKGKKHHSHRPAGTNATQGANGQEAGTNDTTAAGTQPAGKKHHHHPHGVVKAVSAGSLTIEKGKKHKTKTFTVASNVVVEKKGHGKKSSHKSHGAANSKQGNKSGKHAQGGAQSALSEVKVGDHVTLELAGKEVVKILDKGAGGAHKHGKSAQGGKQSKGLGQGA